MLPRGLAGCAAGRFELRQIYGVRCKRLASACRALPAPRGTGFEHIPQSRALLSQVMGPTSLQGVRVSSPHHPGWKHSHHCPVYNATAHRLG